MAKIVAKINDFLRMEASAGVILMLAAALALVANNTILSPLYGTLLSTPVAIQIGGLEIAKPLLLWINDGLMAVFFFLVGLEIKREILEGELSSFDKAVLPIFAAIGGMAAPALIYASINWGNPETLSGWAIPAATDIAFALGILALLGSRVPISLKIFLLAVAIIDDLGAIAIIALFYTGDLSMNALGVAGVGFSVLVALNLLGVKKITPYALVGLVVWTAVLKSGVHATLAGVMIALTVPIKGKREGDQSPLHKIEHDLHPWVAYLVLPVFAFANAGVSFAGLSPSSLLAPVTLGVAVGLFFGKQIGVLALSYFAVATKLARLPDGVSWAQLYGAACLTGVGFTMSLFVGTLAFDTADILNQVRLGVLVGSIASGIVGFLVLASVLKAPASKNASAGRGTPVATPA